jgi:hypothetical protein
MKKKAANQKASNESEPECMVLLNEFMKVFQSIPQRYCLFCEANAALGIEAQSQTAHFAGPQSSSKRVNPPRKKSACQALRKGRLADAIPCLSFLCSKAAPRGSGGSGRR